MVYYNVSKPNAFWTCTRVTPAKHDDWCTPNEGKRWPRITEMHDQVRGRGSRQALLRVPNSFWKEGTVWRNANAIMATYRMGQ